MAEGRRWSDEEIEPLADIVRYDLRTKQSTRDKIANAFSALLADRKRLTGVLGHVREHLMRDENFDADELCRDIEGSADLSEFDRLLRRAETAERELQRISFVSGNIGIEHPEWPDGYAKSLTAVIARAEQAERERDEARRALEAFTVSSPDADGIEWLHVNGGRSVQAMVNLTAPLPMARVAIVDAVDNCRHAPRQRVSGAGAGKKGDK